MSGFGYPRGRLSLGYRGFVGLGLGDPIAGIDPFGVLSSPPLEWRGPVPPVPAAAPSVAPPAAEQGRATGPATVQPLHRAGAREELTAKEGKGNWKEEERQRRSKILTGWEEVLVDDPSASDLGRQLSDAEDVKEAADTLRYAFADKATATLEKRLGSIHLYGRWARAVGMQGALPKTEADVYRYVRALEDALAPPSRAQSFVEAVRFTFGVAGADARIKELLSSRVLGATLASSERKRLLKQCAPLSVRALAGLEHLVIHAASPKEAVMAGTFAFLCHARARYSDLVRVQTEPTLDVSGGQGYIETKATSEHMKTGRAKKRRRREVPIVGLAFGVLGAPWAEAWLAARKAEGLDAVVDGTLVPARSREGWTTASADVTEAGVVLRTLLTKAGLDDSEAARFSTHSCKATLLTWCAKAGIRSEHRRLLGGHSRPKERMVLEYSRDALAGPLSSLSQVLLDIRRGSFDPDADRSGRRGEFGSIWDRFGLQAPAGQQDAEAEAPKDEAQKEAQEVPSEAACSSAEDDSEPDSASSTGSADEVEVAAEEPAPTSETFSSERVLYLHPRYRTLHVAKDADDGGEDRLVCGILKERCHWQPDVKSSSFARFCFRCFPKNP